MPEYIGTFKGENIYIRKKKKDQSFLYIYIYIRCKNCFLLLLSCQVFFLLSSWSSFDGVILAAFQIPAPKKKKWKYTAVLDFKLIYVVSDAHRSNFEAVYLYWPCTTTTLIGTLVLYRSSSGSFAKPIRPCMIICSAGHPHADLYGPVHHPTFYMCAAHTILGANPPYSKRITTYISDVIYISRAEVQSQQQPRVRKRVCIRPNVLNWKTDAIIAALGRVMPCYNHLSNTFTVPITSSSI